MSKTRLALSSLALSIFACSRRSDAIEPDRVPVVPRPAAQSRIDYGAITDPAIRAQADAVATIADQAGLECENGSCYLYDGSNDFCRDQPLGREPAWGNCTGFLLGQDVLATAKHCVAFPSLESMRIVFAWRRDAQGSLPDHIPESDVYRAVATIEVATGDFSLLRLDRPVPNVRPLRAAIHEDLTAHARISLFGHPASAPLKYVPTGRVQSVLWPAAPLLAIASTGGNSGSPVLSNGLVHAIVVGGDHVRRETSTEGRPCLRETPCEEGPAKCSPVVTQALKVMLSHCRNGARDYDETGPDCGSSCGPCAAQRGCRFDSDCQVTLSCRGRVCVD